MDINQILINKIQAKFINHLIKQQKYVNLQNDLFKARREGNFATKKRRLDDIFGNFPPSLTNASTSDNVLAMGPAIFCGLHAPYDLP